VDQYSPIASQGFDVSIYALTNLAMYLQEGKTRYCIYIIKISKLCCKKGIVVFATQVL
jgi:hypothetical protein